MSCTMPIKNLKAMRDWYNYIPCNLFPDAFDLSGFFHTVPLPPSIHDTSASIDGSTLTFSIGGTASILFVYWNGVRLTEGVGYTVTLPGATFTMAGGLNYTPQVGDTLVTVWW